MVIKDIDVYLKSGNYLVLKAFKFAVFPDPIYILNTTNGKVKLLVSKGGYALISGSYTYYDKCFGQSYQVYRCKLDGSKNKALTPILPAYISAGLTVKYTEYLLNGGLYRYTYATGKTVKVR